MKSPSWRIEHPQGSMAVLFDRFYGELAQMLDRPRLLHSLGVTHTALVLAKRYQEDAESVAIAGLLHDCARCLSEHAIGKRLAGAGIVLEEEDRQFPQLWHAILAGEMVKTTFGISDPVIQRAVRIHPTGDEAMCLLDKILFLADYIEPGRSFGSIERVRSLAYQDLDQAVIEALRNKIAYLQKSGQALHSRSLRALADLECRRDSDKPTLV